MLFVYFSIFSNLIDQDAYSLSLHVIETSPPTPIALESDGHRKEVIFEWPCMI